MEWTQTFAKSIKQINARVRCRFLRDDHFIRGTAHIHLPITGNMATMLAFTLGCKNTPDKIRSSVALLAIWTALGLPVLTILWYGKPWTKPWNHRSIRFHAVANLAYRYFHLQNFSNEKRSIQNCIVTFRKYPNQ